MLTVAGRVCVLNAHGVHLSWAGHTDVQGEASAMPDALTLTPYARASAPDVKCPLPCACRRVKGVQAAPLRDILAMVVVLVGAGLFVNGFVSLSL